MDNVTVRCSSRILQGYNGMAFYCRLTFCTFAESLVDPSGEGVGLKAAIAKDVGVAQK